MNRILEVIDQDETLLVLEYVDLDDLKNERIIPDFKLNHGDHSA